MLGAGVRDRGPLDLPADRTDQPARAHQPFDGAPGHGDALTVQRQPDLARPVDAVVRPVHPADVDQQVRVPLRAGAGRLGDVLVVRGRGDRAPVLGQHGADRLDTPAQTLALAVVGVLADELHDQREGRSSSAAKNADAAFRIAFARFSSAFYRRNRRTSADSSVLTPARSPASTCA